MFFQSAAEIDVNVSLHNRRVGPRAIRAKVNANGELGWASGPYPVIRIYSPTHTAVSLWRAQKGMQWQFNQGIVRWFNTLMQRPWSPQKYFLSNSTSQKTFA